MKLHLSVVLLLISLFIFKNSRAQSDYLKFKPYSPYSWMIGAGWSFVDNDGRSHSHILDVKGAWHMLPYPTYLSIDKYINNGFSVELAGSYNTFNGVKMVNEAYPTGETFAVDLAAKYSFYKFFQPVTWFDPYLGLGVGLSNVTTSSVNIFPTANGMVGANFWVQNFGIRLQGTAKLGLVSDIYYNDSNYLQYTASLLYRFHNPERRNDSFNKSKHKWTRKKPKQYKGRSK